MPDIDAKKIGELRVVDETLQAMASQASVPMDLWDKHSNAVLSLMAHIRSLSSRVERAERLAYTGAISLASIDEDAPRPETWKERAENRQAVFLLAKRRAEAAESEAAALRERMVEADRLLIKCFNRIHPLPRTSDTELTDAISNFRARTTKEAPNA